MATYISNQVRAVAPAIAALEKGEVIRCRLTNLRKKLETVVGVTYALNDLSKFTEEEMLAFLETTVALID